MVLWRAKSFFLIKLTTVVLEISSKYMFGFYSDLSGAAIPGAEAEVTEGSIM